MNNHYKRLTAYKKLGFIPGNILDIGAYEGTWTKMVRDVYPTASVIMVEANEDKREILEKVGPTKIALLSNIEGKEVDYHRCQTGIETGNGVYKENTKFDFVPEKRTTTTLKNIFPSEPTFDLIKLDVQGSEMDIIKGGLNIFRKAQTVLMELQTVEYNIGAPMAHEMIVFMDKLGFDFIDVFELMYNEHHQLIQLDGFFRNRNVT